MNKKKILVCGATGFIGRNVAEALSRRPDFEIYGTYFNSSPYEHEQIRLMHADLTDRKDVERVAEDKDVIIQTAAVTSGIKDILTKPYIYVADNAIINSLLLRTSFENNIEHFLFPSSGSVYPSSEKPLKEDDIGEINQAYFGSANTKLYLEKMCLFYSQLGETKYTVFRPSNIYGPYDKFDLERSHVFGATITKVLTTPNDGMINVWGNGEEERDFLYVSDMVDFIEKAIEKQTSKFELFNVSYGVSVPIRDLIKKIVELSGKNLRIEYDSTKPTIKTNIALDSTKARELFNWSPEVTLEDGIKKTIKWYKTNVLS